MTVRSDRSDCVYIMVMVQLRVAFMFSKFLHSHPCVAILDVRLHAKKPASKAYPSSLKTVGDHIRKRRLDLELTQKQAAEKLGVDETSVWNWETGKTDPLVRQVPAVISFLGYDPFASDSGSLANELKRYRLTHGLTQTELARQIGIDPATLSRLEKNSPRHFPKIIKKVNAFLCDGDGKENF
ncbi:MAG: helix-turn-helix domain-containing protein [Thaumarchaeota archaeon]|nr:helix-turn-helix domain-containing protein [Nitrososphaerota archaeon]